MKMVKPYDWVKHVEPELLKHDQIPLTGASPPFPWQELSTRLSKCFELKDFSIAPGKMQWRTSTELLEGLGDHPDHVHIGIPSLSGSLCWVMPEQEISLMMSNILSKESHPFPFQDTELKEGFCRFIYTETLYQLSQLDFDKTLAPCLNYKSNLPTEDSLCLDVAINFGSQTFQGRLIISPEFRRSWVEKYERQPPPPRANEIAQQSEVLLHIEIGKAGLQLDEWASVKPGDFILLDRCSWNPEESKGLITLTSNGTPVLAGSLEKGQCKILDFPQYYEAVATYE